MDGLENDLSLTDLDLSCWTLGFMCMLVCNVTDGLSPVDDVLALQVTER